MRELILSFLLLFAGVFCFAQNGGKVVDSSDGVPLVGAVVSSGNAWAVTDTAGRFTLKVKDNVSAKISCLGYKTLTVTLTNGSTYYLEEDVMSINEVVITATEDHGLTSTTKIGQDAIAHIQPSSFSDVLELLPGGRAIDPAFGSPQLINLRAANTISNSDYATSALGTRFLVDGKPINNDANLQSTPAYSSLGSSYASFGTDMREISTDDIESVDVVRGIASVEYGDLTSGLIKINRRKGGNDLRARFKADMKSKLFYVGKGFETGGDDKLTMNASLSYLDSKVDPREPRQSWKRLTGSYRIGKTWTSGEKFTKSISGSIDYTGSFDNEKSDADIDNVDGNPIETYKSTYHKFALGGDFTLTSKDEGFFRSLVARASLSYENDVIDRWKHVTNGAMTPISTSLEAGEWDAELVPATYDATLKVEGRPMYIFASAVANFRTGIHRMKAGVEWNMDKNFGEGYIFDVSRPLSTSMNVRPRAYSDIPATHNFSAYVEENGSKEFNEMKLEWMAGLRLETLAGAGSDYDINFKPYLDPRANIRLNLPSMLVNGYKFDWGVYIGGGYHTKFPTMDQLYPDPIYGDITQFNYWPTETELRRINLLVYKINTSPYTLSAARNFKWEIGADFDWNGFTFSIDYFREDMRSGFRYGYDYMNVVFKDYDESVINKSTLTGPPSLEGVPYVLDTLLTAYSMTTNGSRTLKQGIEFTFSTKRIKAINTKITANGAWFRTEYENSVPEYYRPSYTINGKSFPYVGVYDRNDGSLYDVLNTNIMFDTQIPRLGLIFSTSFQTQWFSGHQSKEKDPNPVGYIDKELNYYEWTAAAASDAVLSHLVRDYTPSLYEYEVTPFSMNINLKVSKKLYKDKMTCSLFVNRIFDITPNYTRNNIIVRRSVVPYFGMELDFKL